MRLGKKIILTTGSVIVVMGLVTVGVLHAIVSDALGRQLDDKGTATARVLANDLANALLDGDELVVQRNLDRFAREDQSVVYAYAMTPDRDRVIHTLPGGEPGRLIQITQLPEGQNEVVRQLATDRGRVRDYAVRVLEGTDAEVHVGLTEASISASQQRVTLLIIGLTASGVVLAIFLAWVLGRYVARPLELLTASAEQIGEGRLDLELSVSSRDEVGELAESFNHMVFRLREAMEHERSRNRELTALNAVARVVSLGEDQSDVMNQALGEMVASLGLAGAWLMLAPDDPEQSVEVAAHTGVVKLAVGDCSCHRGAPCSCWSALQSGARVPHVRAECPVARRLPPARRVEGPFPLVAGGIGLGFFNVVVPDTVTLTAQDHEILWGIGQQLGVSLQRNRLWLKLLEREERVSQLLQKVIDAQEDERCRIARELHDDTSQSLAAMAVRLKAAASLVERDPTRATALLDGLKESMANTLREIHNIVYDLRPTILDDRGLVPALHWCASQRLLDQGVAVDVTASGISRRLEPQLETTLYRIGQEAISNAAKHASARNLRIHVYVGETQVQLSVADDGRGFSATPMGGEQGEKRTLGLIGMVERAALLGGTCQINSVPGEGTRIDVALPLVS